MPTDKRARQKAGRAARRAAEERRRKRRRLLRNSAIVGGLAIVVVGSVLLITQPWKSTSATGSATSTTSTTLASSAREADQKAANATAVAAGCPASTSTRVNILSWSAAPAMTIDTASTYRATVETTVGTFVITLDPKTAPQSVNNFVFLANQGFYRCVIFHRVIPGFVDQTGDPTGTGQGGPGYTIPDEYPPKAADSKHQYALGAVAMANTGQPNTGGSQWFVVAGPQGEALPNTYSLFGHVTSGMSVVDKINADGSSSGVPPDVTQRILKVTISSS